MKDRPYNSVYDDNHNGRISFPLGGMGAGMIGLEGRGGLSHVSLHNHPDTTHEPLVFSALIIKSDKENIALVLEGQVPEWKIFAPGNKSGLGSSGKHYGLPRFQKSSFESRFPFGTVQLWDDQVPVKVAVKGWSPFTPIDADSSSLPVVALEYTFCNTSDHPLEMVYSFHAANLMTAYRETDQVLPTANGFILFQPASKEQPWEQRAFSAVVDQPQAVVNYAWFRGAWFDAITMVWNSVEAGVCLDAPPIESGKPSPGASIYVPLELAPLEQKTIRLKLAWHVPETNLTVGVPDNLNNANIADKPIKQTYYKPWYSHKFQDIHAITRYWADSYETLKAVSERFSTSFYDTTLPPEIIEAIAANLTVLKSPTVLRQTDGRIWGWEGCEDGKGSCHGSCTHVWNYAQALPHLFADMERSLRETEFNESQDDRGHQGFRASLPIGPIDHHFHAAADGQLGGIMKAYREWRISGDLRWLQQLWPKVKQSLDYCIETWDPRHHGVLEEPHHNTYDIEFWGADGMCSSIYLGALKAAVLMSEGIGESSEAYDALYQKGKHYLESKLFNGEFFEQKIQWEGLSAPSPALPKFAWSVGYSPEAERLLKEQGPKYQYGKGCLSDGIIGAWFAEMCGLGEIINCEMVKSHLLSVFKYNLKHDLSRHANPQRPGYALGNEGGLLLCTWPKGGKLDIPFVYSNEVWTGIEYQVASHLMSIGCVEEGLEIVKVCRDRYNGRLRNPFNEYECGHWYARAMASYGLIQGITGIRYDAVDRILHISPHIPGDFRSFLSTASGYGVTGVKDGKPFFEIKEGIIQIDQIRCQ